MFCELCGDWMQTETYSVFNQELFLLCPRCAADINAIRGYDRFPRVAQPYGAQQAQAQAQSQMAAMQQSPNPMMGNSGGMYGRLIEDIFFNPFRNR